MDGDAIASLYLAIVDNIFSSMLELQSEKEIWDTLTNLYEAKSLHKKIFLKRKLYIVQMLESTSMTEHINTLKNLFFELSAMKHNIEQKECVELLHQSLTDSYDHLIINLVNGVLRAMLVFNDVATIVLERESRCKNKENVISSQQTEALVEYQQNVVLVGINKTGQSPKVRRRLNVIIVESKDTKKKKKKSIGTTKKRKT